MKLVTLDRIKQRLGIPLKDDFDDLLSNWITAVSAQCEKYLNRSLTAVTDEVFYWHDGGMCIPLPAFPVTTVTAIYDSLSIPRVYDTTSLVPSDYYVVTNETGLVYRLSDEFSEGRNAVKVIYSGGYEIDLVNTDLLLDVPEPICQGVEDQVVFYWTRRHNMDVTATQVGSGNLSYSEKWGLLPGVRAAWNPYKRWILG